MLKDYPYLIDENLVGGKLRNQYKIELSDGKIDYIDLIYFKDNEITIIELKKGKIKKKDIVQLSEYVNHFVKNSNGMKIHGILIGQEIDIESAWLLKNKGFIYKQLFRDIPFKLKMCENCRKIMGIHEEKCKWCNSNKFIHL